MEGMERKREREGQRVHRLLDRRQEKVEEHTYRARGLLLKMGLSSLFIARGRVEWARP
jgi:hypothetical protein